MGEASKLYACARVTEYNTELDELTFQRAQRGDHQAFRLLVERYHHSVFSLLWRMLEPGHSRQDIEDLTQETFLRVFRALERFDYHGTARLSTWILTISYRLALNELRRNKACPLAIQLDAGIAGTDRADSQLRQNRIGKALRSAIQRLEPGLRAVIILREYHGFTYAEISDMTQTDINTVKSRLARARASLKAALEDVRYEQT